MKKFNFSLSRMLDYKDQVLEKEKGSLSQLRGQKNKLELEIENLEDEFSNCDLRMKEETLKGTSVLTLQSYNYMMESIRREVERLTQQCKVLDVAIEKQMKVVVKASQEVSGLDKLKEKQLEEYNHMLAKNDELMISEFISSKLIREREAQTASV